MLYERIVPGFFIERLNRFVAKVQVEGTEVLCHVKNTGRCRELFIPGVPVYLQRSLKEDRKTLYDLITVEKEGRLVNVDSQAPNQVIREWMEAGGLGWQPEVIRGESTFGRSRFDFYLEDEKRRGYLEVKGCTLERDNVGLFPDAPTLRGVKHLEELIQVKEQGFFAGVVFLIQMEGVRLFKPNDETHPAFGDALRECQRKGVEIIALDSRVTPTSLEYGKRVPVEL